LTFVVDAVDPRTAARACTLTTPHGVVKTPVYMPVGTQAAMRNLTPAQVVEAGAQIVLANTYHLALRPGEALIAKAGGLHRFSGYPLPILTDSGGFQVFSLPKIRVGPDGVAFKYEVDGRSVFLSPERSIEIQDALGSDIAMVFDECVPFPCPRSRAEEAVKRTTAWARRCKAHHRRSDQALFGIVQGSAFPDLRRRSAQDIVDLGFDGYAIGGLSVGEGREVMTEILDVTVPELPRDRPRYLMGVGLPEDLLVAVERGVDMVDCVVPTRHARGGVVYTFQGRLRLQNARYRKDMYPIDTRCQCYTCRNFSRAYLRHLYNIREMLAGTLAGIHNIHFFQELMARMRKAILDGNFLSFKKDFLERYNRRKDRGQ